MDCSTQADASSIPSLNVAGIFSAAAWYRVLFRAFAFSPQRSHVPPSASLRIPFCRTARMFPGAALSEPGGDTVAVVFDL